jgi:hypothetical protein
LPDQGSNLDFSDSEAQFTNIVSLYLF